MRGGNEGKKEAEEERSVAEECASKREHGYKRIALPLQSCDVVAQICFPSFLLSFLSPFSDTALSPEIIGFLLIPI